MSSRTTLIALSAVLVALTVASYAPVYRADFVDFDDGAYVTENEHVYTGLTGDNIDWAFTQYHSSNWHPLTWISHMLDVEMFGTRSASGHHAMNVAMHALNAVLLFLMLQWMTKEVAPSFAVALLFAIHPVNVESVAWVAQRKTTLSTLFGILAIWSYALYARRADWRWYAGSLALFALSLMSKQMLVTLPLALLLLDFWPIERPQFGVSKRNQKSGSGKPPAGKSVATSLTFKEVARGWWQLLPEKVPYLLLTVIMSVVTLIVQHGAMASAERYPLSQRLENVGTAYGRYLVTLVWPSHLAIFYPMDSAGLSPAHVVASVAVLLANTVACVWWGLKRRYLLVGWLWYLGTMVPVIGLVHVGMQSMADRYAYVPFWGLAIILAWGFRDMLAWLQVRADSRRWAFAATLAILSVVLSVLTYRQCEKWNNSITLFEDALADTGENWLADNILAKHYMGKDDLEQAIFHSKRSIAAKHNLGEVYGTYGLALFQSGKHKEAIEAFEQSVKASPQSTWGYTNLGWANSELGDYEQAVTYLAQAAARIRPGSSRDSRRTIYANWGNALRKLNRMSEAREKYDTALAVDPNAIYLLRDAATVDLALGVPQRATERLQRALSLDPNDAESLQLLAQVLRSQDKLPEAAEALQRVLSLPGSHLDSALQLAQVLGKLRRFDDAKRLLGQILASSEKVDNQNAKLVTSTVRVQLAALAVDEKQRDQAIQHFDAALAAWPDNPTALNNLAWLLATDSRSTPADGKRALELAQRNLNLAGPDNVGALGTLAAAQASTGQFSEAATTLRRAQTLAQQTGQAKMLPALNRQLQAYERGEIYHGD